MSLTDPIMMTHGSLFSGIGGFDCGFEELGICTSWMCEINSQCRLIQARHFPRALPADGLSEP